MGQRQRVVTEHCAILDTVRTEVTGDRTLDNHEQLLVSTIVSCAARQLRRTITVRASASHWSTFRVRCVQSTIAVRASASHWSVFFVRCVQSTIP